MGSYLLGIAIDAIFNLIRGAFWLAAAFAVYWCVGTAYETLIQWSKYGGGW